MILAAAGHSEEGYLDAESNDFGRNRRLLRLCVWHGLPRNDKKDKAMSTFIYNQQIRRRQSPTGRSSCRMSPTNLRHRTAAYEAALKKLKEAR
jgi:hypothetical protein